MEYMSGLTFVIAAQTKNVAGRLLVGLRWWNEVTDEGSNWRFETLEEVRSTCWAAICLEIVMVLALTKHAANLAWSLPVAEHTWWEFAGAEGYKWEGLCMFLVDALCHCECFSRNTQIFPFASQLFGF